MTRETLTVERFNHSHWRKATREEFSALWEAECARVPEFSESEFHIITGLLLPIWDRLPAQNMRVYRFKTEDRERVIGRLVTPEALDRFYESLGVDSSPGLSPDDAWSAALDRGAVLDLVGGLQIRRSLVMNAHRVELTGVTDGMARQLKAPGSPRRSSPGACGSLCRSRKIVARHCSPPFSNGIRSLAPVAALRPDPDMSGVERRRSGAPPRARCRGRVPPLPLQRSGRYWIVGDVMNTPGRSLYVRLTGPDYGPGAAGKWTDAAATAEHGDLLDLIRRNRELPGLSEAIDEACRFLALPRDERRTQPEPAATNSSKAARRLFRAGQPINGTPAEAYLRARGITGCLDWVALRFHPRVWYRETETAPLEAWPALLAGVTDP